MSGERRRWIILLATAVLFAAGLRLPADAGKTMRSPTAPATLDADASAP